MSRLPLPSTATLKAIAKHAPKPTRPLASAALNWLSPNNANNLDGSDETWYTADEEDDIERRHEEEERARQLLEPKPEMSRMSVPVVSGETLGVGRYGGKPKTMKDLPGQGKVKAKAKESDGKKRAALRKSPAPTRTRTPTPPTPERMTVPTPPSRMSSPFELTGSEFILPTKVRLYPHERERVARELQEAMSNNFFKMWPTIEDDRGGREAKEAMEESGLFQRELGEQEREKREELMRAWKGREERSVQGRRRLEGGFGYESVVEGEKLREAEGFRPTLGRVEEGSCESRKSRTNSMRDEGRESIGPSEGTARDQRERKTSSAGNHNRTKEVNSRRQNRPSRLQPRLKTKHESKIRSSKNATKVTTKYRSWSKDHAGEKNSEDDYPFNPRPRKK